MTTSCQTNDALPFGRRNLDIEAVRLGAWAKGDADFLACLSCGLQTSCQAAKGGIGPDDPPVDGAGYGNVAKSIVNIGEELRGVARL